jgi:hypothetical protein
MAYLFTQDTGHPDEEGSAGVESLNIAEVADSPLWLNMRTKRRLEHRLLLYSIGEDGFFVLRLGDCSCVVIRNGKVTAKTKDIQHYFDCPYQLSADSPDRPKDGI